MVQYFEKQDKTVLRLKNYVVVVVDWSPLRQLDRWCPDAPIKRAGLPAFPAHWKLRLDLGWS